MKVKPLMRIKKLAKLPVVKKLPEKQKLILRPSPFEYVNFQPVLVLRKEVNLLQQYLRWNYNDLIEPNGGAAPDFVFARALGVHRIVWEQWKIALMQYGYYMDRAPSLLLDNQFTVFDYPEYDGVRIIPEAVPMYTLRDFGGPPARNIELQTFAYDPYDPEWQKWDSKFYRFADNSKHAVWYVDDYYRSDMDEYYAAYGEQRPCDEGHVFAPVQIVSEPEMELVHATENWKRKIAEACRVKIGTTRSPAEAPTIVPPHRLKKPGKAPAPKPFTFTV